MLDENDENGCSPHRFSSGKDTKFLFDFLVADFADLLTQLAEGKFDAMLHHRGHLVAIASDIGKGDDGERIGTSGGHKRNGTGEFAGL